MTGPVPRLAAAVAALAPRRRVALAFGLGILATAALPPTGIVPLLAVAFTGLVWLMDGAGTPSRAFWTGWFFAFGHFVAGLHWIANALLVDAEHFAWAVPFAVLLLPAGLAIFGGLATFAAFRLWRPGVRRVLALALCWSAAEWLRGHVLTGFPWNVAGYAWADVAPLRQGAALGGIWTLGLLTLALAGLPATLGDENGNGYGGRGLARRLGPVGAGLFGLGLLALWGAARLPADPPSAEGDPARPVVRIVQGNIDQRMKWSPEERAAIHSRYQELSRAPAARPLAAVIWPETATPYLLDSNPDNARAVAAAAPPGGVLLTGAVRVRQGPGPEDIAAWNSLLALDGSGAVLGTYDKAHLVPFGEYLPLRPLLSRVGMDRLAAGAVDFSAGPGPRTLALGGLPPFAVLICYEAIFPASAFSDTRPEWLLNVTNDAWFGDSDGPPQHLAMARMRAVEQGMPLVRAANTGISAIFDPFGREIGRIPLGRAGTLDATLPPPLQAPPLYAWAGDWIYLMVFLGMLFSCQFGRRRAV